MDNKEALYKKRWKISPQIWYASCRCARAWYLLAAWYAEKAQQYDPLKNVPSLCVPACQEICEKVIAQKVFRRKKQLPEPVAEYPAQELSMQIEK